MIGKALSALRFSKNATTKLTPFEVNHGRKANTVLRNLTKKPSLKNFNWSNVLKQKCLCLDENDYVSDTVSYPQDSNWEEKSDLVYAPPLRKAPLILDSDQQGEVNQGEGTKAMPPYQWKRRPEIPTSGQLAER